MDFSYLIGEQIASNRRTGLPIVLWCASRNVGTNDRFFTGLMLEDHE